MAKTVLSLVASVSALAFAFSAASAQDDMAAETEVDPAIQAALEAGDAEAGAAVYRLCMACHTLDEGVNRLGPSLYGIIGRTAGTVEGFRYSPANAESGMVWTEANLFTYLERPQAMIPRTTMAFAGIPDEQKRADLIAHIRENGGLVEAPAEAEAETETEDATE